MQLAISVPTLLCELCTFTINLITHLPLCSGKYRFIIAHCKVALCVSNNSYHRRDLWLPRKAIVCFGGSIKTSSFHVIHRRYEATVTYENQTDRKFDILQTDRETVSQQTDWQANRSRETDRQTETRQTDRDKTRQDRQTETDRQTERTLKVTSTMEFEPHTWIYFILSFYVNSNPQPPYLEVSVILIVARKSFFFT